MFSYRHAFHAGNHADVLKHLVLIQLLKYLGQKEAGFLCVDTHAGAGLYALDAEHATKSGESRAGIARLWDRRDLPKPVAEYVELIKRFNQDGKLRRYPGSPFIADRYLRPQDRLRLFEMHPTDTRMLAENLRKLEAHAAEQGKAPVRGKRILMQHSDGFAGLKALLPPPTRRGLILIDPSYEMKDDYRAVRIALQDALARFSTGTYAVWYPLLQRMESRELPEKLKRLPAGDWLDVTLTVGAPSPDGFGLRSSGMFILNPPWTLEATLRETMPFLVAALGVDSGATFTLQSGKPLGPVPGGGLRPRVTP